MDARSTVRNRKRLRDPRGGLVRLGWWIGVAALVAQVVGCTPARQSDAHAEGSDGVFRPAVERDVSAKGYRVAPPDRLVIRAPGVKGMDNFVTQIRPDGKISINLVREVYVANKTPEEISQILTAAAAKYYNNVQVRVDVADYASKFYQVFGLAVRDPGPKPYTG